MINSKRSGETIFSFVSTDSAVNQAEWKGSAHLLISVDAIRVPLRPAEQTEIRPAELCNGRLGCIGNVAHSRRPASGRRSGCRYSLLRASRESDLKKKRKNKTNESNESQSLRLSVANGKCKWQENSFGANGNKTADKRNEIMGRSDREGRDGASPSEKALRRHASAADVARERLENSLCFSVGVARV